MVYFQLARINSRSITTRGASKERDDYHLTSQLSDEAFNAMGMDEKQLLQIDFDRPEPFDV